jgi:hypothetical protein
MADKWDELTQLEEAYNTLKTQPRDAQIRMMWWLGERLAADEKEDAAKIRSPSPLKAVTPNG